MIKLNIFWLLTSFKISKFCYGKKNKTFYYKMSVITLLGDSVLDNFYWLENRSNDLKNELEMKGYIVNNFAVDESRLDDIINGIIPRDIYMSNRSYPYPIDGYKVNPLALASNTKSDVIVLSVGGNDLRANIMSLFFGVDQFINKTFTPAFVDKYENLLSMLISLSKKVILVVVYIPFLGTGSPYSLITGSQDIIYSRVRNLYYGLGRKYNIPVLDLSMTFDPFDRSHYGTTEIEPSNLSNKTISNLIDHITTYYKGYTVYYAPKCGSIVSTIP